VELRILRILGRLGILGGSRRGKILQPVRRRMKLRSIFRDRKLLAGGGERLRRKIF
jgi:hypothetical protein